MVPRRIWPKTTKIYWDPDYDIPVIKPRHEQVDLFYVIRLTEPGDARPGFPRDYERLRRSIVYEFGTDKLYKELFENRFILLNKVPHWDQMWEVISSGNVWGQLYYDPFSTVWRFRLTYSGAYYAYANGVVESVMIDEKPRKGYHIASKDRGTRQVVVVDKQGEVVGLAEKADKGYIVTKVFRARKPLVETSNRRSNLEDVLKYNEEGLEQYKNSSVKFLRKLHDRHPLPIVVSYSGGKDSLVALHLTLEALGEPILLFNDTGLEMPDTVRNVELVAEKYGLRLVKAEARDTFWKAVWSYGPPGKDYRWCCKIAKLIPIARVSRAKWSSGALNIVGQRAYESIDRAKSPAIWRNRWIPHLLSTSPIQEWNQLVEWLYILKYKLPYNPLYDVGFERLGCYMCPASTLAEFSEVERICPNLWSKWLTVLEYWREKLNCPAEWIKLGLWRWLTPAVAKHRIAKQLKGYVIDWKAEYRARLIENNIKLAPLNVKCEKNSLTIIFTKKLLNEHTRKAFKSYSRILKAKILEESSEVVIVETKYTQILIRDKVLEISPYITSENLEDMVDVIKILYRLHGCTRCGSCVLWCPFKAIRLVEQTPFPGIGCSGCRICLEVCPIAEMLVERVVLPLILNDPGSWKRSSRRRVPEEYKMLVIIRSINEATPS